jgi:hypothetical protein
LEANWQVIKSQIEKKNQNGEVYAGLTKTPYRNIMLDKQVLKIEEKLLGHKSFLP